MLRKLITFNKTITLPSFPNFVFLKPHHQAALMEATAGNALYSDYNFISLWSWDHRNKLKICKLNDNLVIRFQDYTKPNHYFYSFFGTNKVDETIQALLDYSAQEGIHELKLIPQFVVERIQDPSHFSISEDRDSFDYIMAINDMVELPNGENATKRHILNKFQREYGERMTVRELDVTNKTASHQVLAVAKRWGKQTRSDGSYEKNERRAITKVVNNARKIKRNNLHVVGLYIDDDLKAFSINEIIDGGFALGHYKKTDRNYPGIGVAMDNYTAKTLREKGVTHLNHEQDLGIEGLRKAKLASHPVYFLKKYRIALAQK